MSKVWFQTTLASIGGNLAYAELPTGGGVWANGGTLSITGGVTTVAGLTTTAAAGLTFTAAIGQIVPGATSLSLRNTANNADNLLVSDAGNVTVRAAFGCNGKAAQAAVVAGAAAPAGGVGVAAGAWSLAADRDTAITMINQMRTALIAMGIMA